MHGVLLIAALVAPPEREVLVDRFDRIEINHVEHNQQPVFVQYIFWDWCHESGEGRVQACAISTGARPQRRGAQWVLEWRSLYSGPRRVLAAAWVETQSNYDIEVANRARWPVHRRRGLSRRPPR